MTRTGWSRWSRHAGTVRYPEESPRDVLWVGPGRWPYDGRFHWNVGTTVRDPEVRLETLASGSTVTLADARAAADAAWKELRAPAHWPTAERLA